MSMTKLTLLVLGSIAAATTHAARADADLVSKVFHDGAYLPRVYDETDILRRYGEGESSVDDVGLIRRRYWDPSTALEVVISSNPDIAATVRTVDEIRVSAIATGPQSVKETESLKGLNLKGVVIGDPEAKGKAAAEDYGQTHSSREKLGRLDVESVCGYADSGSSICFYSRGKRIVAMAVGFGP
ncbi:hypothetical protein [Stenotrophomonas sp. PS02289]|uniref:hypothetical protein n=1 Tax=Stenotrophomonas sp. PS02289 TaxID=2991422 RepID=UPI00249CA11E|nr:hypothetical protein [Stenotrophomonas sp. PS02289]